jgi:hypothetical protein
MAEDPTGEDHDVFIANREVRVPPALGEQRPCEGDRQRVSDLILGLELQNGPHRRLGVCRRLGDVASCDPGNPETGHLQRRTHPQAFRQQSTLQHSPTISLDSYDARLGHAATCAVMSMSALAGSYDAHL